MSLASRVAVSMWPSGSSGMTTISAMDSRQGNSLEWCSNGPMNTTGRSAATRLTAAAMISSVMAMAASTSWYAV